MSWKRKIVAVAAPLAVVAGIGSAFAFSPPLQTATQTAPAHAAAPAEAPEPSGKPDADEPSGKPDADGPNGPNDQQGPNVEDGKPDSPATPGATVKP